MNEKKIILDKLAYTVHLVFPTSHLQLGSSPWTLRANHSIHFRSEWGFTYRVTSTVGRLSKRVAARFLLLITEHFNAQLFHDLHHREPHFGFDHRVLARIQFIRVRIHADLVQLFHGHKEKTVPFLAMTQVGLILFMGRQRHVKRLQHHLQFADAQTQFLDGRGGRDTHMDINILLGALREVNHRLVQKEAVGHVKFRAIHAHDRRVAQRNAMHEPCCIPDLDEIVDPELRIERQEETTDNIVELDCTQYKRVGVLETVDGS